MNRLSGRKLSAKKLEQNLSKRQEEINGYSSIILFVIPEKWHGDGDSQHSKVPLSCDRVNLEAEKLVNSKGSSSRTSVSNPPPITTTAPHPPMTIPSRGSISLLRPLRPSLRPFTAPSMPLRAKITNPNLARKVPPKPISPSARLTRQMSATTAAAQPEDENDVLFSQQRGNRTIVLNRPKKLNSLNLSMIDKILPRLKVRFRLSVKSD